jgi:hypothetical protein
MILVVRVEMRSVMLTSGLDEHPDDDAEKAREFGHVPTLHRPRSRRRADALPLSRERRHHRLLEVRPVAAARRLQRLLLSDRSTEDGCVLLISE